MQYLKEEIRSNILAAALREFQENGYQDSSMRTIASNAGVALGSVYRYFKNKDELFNSIVEPVYTSFTSMVFDLYQQQDDIPMMHLIAQDITDKIMEFYSKYETELMILMDKSKGSNYEDLKDELIRLLDYRLKNELIPSLLNMGIELKDDYILYVVAASFVEGLFIIIRKYREQFKIKELIGQLLIFYFEDLQNRIR